MKIKLKQAFTHELNLAKQSLAQNDIHSAYYHLERAHILGQRHYIPHVLSHYWMLKVATTTQDYREVIGQLLRIIGSVGSLINWIPVGNTGRANVSAIKPMPIPHDLQQLLKE